jgi:hypothetical protein
LHSISSFVVVSLLVELTFIAKSIEGMGELPGWRSNRVFGPPDADRLSGCTLCINFIRAHSRFTFASSPVRRFPSPSPSACRSAEKIRRRTLGSALVSRSGGPTGLEPAASCVTGRRSNQLNYAPASKINSSRLPRVPPDAHRFPKLPENAVTVHGSE